MQIDADATRFEQILGNLIANAAKYTDRGGHILVAAEREGGDAVIRVRDDGIGISPEMMPGIFDLFAQADRTLDRSEGGLGIGLTLPGDSNLDAAESLGMLIEALGHRAVVVHDGPSALEAVRIASFEMILMDIGLPGMDGYQVAQRMRDEFDLDSARLIALTGDGRDEDRRRTIASGFDLHLVKPVHPGALEKLLTQTADEPNSRQQRPSNQAS